jgi:polyribonucleotide nucleotidyltransferase
MSKITKSFQYGNHQVTLETGEIARQADGAVMVSMGDTQILVTVVAVKSAKEGQDFFPLMVQYQEKAYAAGKIPGGFLKREARLSEKETLLSRLIDRPIRPLFPKGFVNEVQIIATVMSLDESIGTEVPAMLGTSAALAISGIPFDGPVGAAIVGYSDKDGYKLNPSTYELEMSDLELSVAGTSDAVLMVESEATELSEKIMLGAVMFGHQQMQVAITAISEFKAEVAKPTWDWQAEAENVTLKEQVFNLVKTDVEAAYKIADKMARYDALDTAKSKVKAELVTAASDIESGDVDKIFGKLQKEVVRGRIIAGEPRIDGRDASTVRDIQCKVGILNKAHGSALFTRGETQAIVVTTLGTEKDSKIVDDLAGSYHDRFMMHYNFPPYSVGECGRVGMPGRREIGHGMLARRGVAALLPTVEEFPYTIRVVSEITESNGSSSMASVCGTSMSLMHAGVPIDTPIAGIAMGLVKEESGFAVLSDILGDEDYLGDMDFKVAGTAEGITALQMDIKISGITEDIMEIALSQAKVGRMTILDAMSKAISKSNTYVSSNAPKFFMVKVKPEKVREIIGKGGSNIRALTEETGCVIEIDDDGNVKIAAKDNQSAEIAKARIAEITAEPEIGKTYDAVVKKIVDFGAFVAYMPGKEGLVHVSQIAEERVEDVSAYLSEGEEIQVKLIDIDKQGRVKLSIKEALNN